MTKKLGKFHESDIEALNKKQFLYVIFEGRKTEEMHPTLILGSYLGPLSRKWDTDLCSMLQSWGGLD